MSQQIHDLHKALAPLSPLHFIGIGGSGMAPLAGLIHSAGISISGSDSALNRRTSSAFSGVPLSGDQEDTALVRAAKTIVVSTAIKQNHAELVFARKCGKVIMHRSEVLALVSAQFKTIAVSGTHGKSTTSALIAHLLLGLGLDPSFILGANLKAHNQQGSPYQLGEGEYLVVEADESDGSFQRYYPWLAVVTNIDQDHLDFYKSMRAMEDAYLRLLQNINSEGTAVLFWDHARVRELTEKTFTSRKLSYGSFIGAEVRMIKFNQQGSSFLISIVVEHEVVDLVVPLIGRHNAYNVVGSLAVLRALGLPLAESRNILANFPGVSRRMDLYFSSHSRTIYDDFAHNPVKISSCLKGVREAFPASHITAVFQAHRYTRLQHMYTEMMSAFSSADTVIVVPVYAAGEEVPLLSTEDSADRESLEFSFTPKLLALDIARFSRVETFPVESLKEAMKLLQLDLNPKHVVIVTLGAGDVWTVAERVAEFLKAK